MTDSPFEYDDTHHFTAAERLPAGHPTRLLEALRDKLPAENKELPKPRFFMDPRAMSLVNIIRGGLDTAGRWLEGKPEKLKSEDMLGPLGGAGLMAAGMTKPVAGSLGAFIGPGQVERLGLTPGSRGSLEALEKAQATWAKGGTDPGALAETWAKHGWAPPESFGAGNAPFTWLQMPELRVRDSAMDDIQAKLGQGGAVKYTGQLQSILEPTRDARQLFTAEPSMARATGTLRVGPNQDWAGYATPAGKWASEPPDTPMRPMVMGQGRDPTRAESIMMGHELRGHAMPMLGNVQRGAKKGEVFEPIYNTRANEIAEGYPAVQDRAARSAAYFDQPAERMARHAHVLDQIERGGGSPFTPSRAPGVMSTYTNRAFLDRQVFDDMTGGHFKPADLVPGSGRGQKPLTADDLEAFLLNN